MHAIALFIRLLALLAATAACNQSLGQSAPSAANGSSVSLISISPATSEVLHPGEKATLVVEIAYELNADSGNVNLVVQAANGLHLAGDIEVITKGSGRAKLRAEFIVPETKAIEVFIPLSADGQSSTSTLVHRVYRVSAS